MKTYTKDLQLRGKKVISDAAMTFHDVTLVKCAGKCTSKDSCTLFFYNKASRECALCANCGNCSLVADPDWNGYGIREGNKTVFLTKKKAPYVSI
jgi:hypothetical protein